MLYSMFSYDTSSPTTFLPRSTCRSERADSSIRQEQTIAVSIATPLWNAQCPLTFANSEPKAITALWRGRGGHLSLDNGTCSRTAKSIAPAVATQASQQRQGLVTMPPVTVLLRFWWKLPLLLLLLLLPYSLLSPSTSCAQRQRRVPHSHWSSHGACRYNAEAHEVCCRRLYS